MKLSEFIFSSRKMEARNEAEDKKIYNNNVMHFRYYLFINLFL